MTNILCTSLGMRYPIILGGLARIGTAPLVAAVSNAGGIGDGRGLAAALALGAVGVQMGTMFLSSEECEVAPVFKEMLIRARETATQLFPNGKAMRRAFKDSFHSLALKELSHLSSESSLEVDTVLTGAGQISGLIQSVRPVADIIEGMMQQAREVLPGLSDQLENI